MTAKMTVIAAGELFMIVAADGKGVVFRADQDGHCTDITSEYLRGRLTTNQTQSAKEALALRRLDKGE
jgi:hypothetical protein